MLGLGLGINRGFVPAGESFIGLLDSYSGAAAAYSVRRLSSTYTGSAIRIREDGTDTELDIGFDSNGDLDTAAIATHCGVNNGYVDTWYDQSGNSIDLIQATYGSQPQIYNGAAVITQNGKPAVYFDNTIPNYMDSASTQWSSAGDTSVFIVREVGGGTGDRRVWNTIDPSSTRSFLIDVRDSQMTVFSSTNANAFVKKSKALSARNHVWSWIHDANADLTLYIDNTQEAQTASTISMDTSSAVATMCARSFGSEGYVTTHFQELIHYPDDQTDNRAGITTNINDYYSIY